LNQLDQALGKAEEEPRASTIYYYVPPMTRKGVQLGWGDMDDWGEVVGYSEQDQTNESIDRFLVLPQQDLPVHEPLPA
jgi:hypothetical protein